MGDSSTDLWLVRGILWRLPTGQLARDMLAAGVRAIVTCIDPSKLDPSFAGRSFDAAFLDSLPEEIDPCGENGEFHTFVFDGPDFSAPVKFSLGETVLRESFWFCDLLPE